MEKRERKFNTNMVYVVVILLITSLLGGCAGDSTGSSAGGSNITTLIQMSQGEGNAMYEMNIATARVINSESDTVELATTTASGPVHTVRAVGQGEADVVQADLYNLVHCYRNTGAWEDTPQEIKPYGGYATYSMGFFIVTLKNRDDINCLADLAGKTWNFGGAGTSAGQAWSEAFKILGILDDIDVIYTDPAEEPDALIMGVADAILGHTIMGGRGLAARCRDLDARAEIKLVQPTEEEWETLRAHADQIAPYYLSTTPLDIYQQDLGADEALYLEQPSGFAFSPVASEDAVYEYMKTVFDNRSALVDITSQLAEFEDKGIDLSISYYEVLAQEGIPIHPGVVRYLKEVGVWEDHWIAGE